MSKTPDENMTRPPPDRSNSKRRLSSSSSSESSDDSQKKAFLEEKRINEGKFEALSHQVSEILQYLKNSSRGDPSSDSDSDISLHPSEVLQSSLISDGPFLNKPQLSQPPATARSLDFNINTNLKEPNVNNADQTRLDLLTKLHHFNSDRWERVRYVETEKKYLAKPGFYELDVNIELRHHDPNSSWLKSLDRSFGAMTHALIQQNTLFKNNLQDLIQWSFTPGCVLNADTLFEKINSSFAEKSEYMKVSEDLLQMVCGRRADTIQRRRDSILSGVKDRYIKEDIRRIPPTNAELFNAEVLSSFLQKAGGTSKLFSGLKRSAEEPLMSMRNRPDHSRAKRPRRSYSRPEPECDPMPSTSFSFPRPQGKKPQRPQSNKSGTKRNEYKKSSDYNNRKNNRFQK